jgi:hypothetical protein
MLQILFLTYTSEDSQRGNLVFVIDVSIKAHECGKEA